MKVIRLAIEPLGVRPKEGRGLSWTLPCPRRRPPHPNLEVQGDLPRRSCDPDYGASRLGTAGAAILSENPTEFFHVAAGWSYCHPQAVYDAFTAHLGLLALDPPRESDDMLGDPMSPLLSRITIDPDICHGKPAVRHLRYPVESLLEYLAAGDTFEDLLAEFPDLERDDLRSCLEFATQSKEE
jgi:uncharacterized protein (DUF433 family)